MADELLAARIAKREAAAFELLMRQHNGRLFRVARAILKDDGEAEDALQDAYLEAYRHIGTFRGTSTLSTWLMRIVINQALMRVPARSATASSCPLMKRRARARSLGPGRSSRRPMPCGGRKSGGCSNSASTSCRRPSARSSSCGRWRI
jgi:hypothetical protein